MATHSSILAWRIPVDRLQSMSRKSWTRLQGLSTQHTLIFWLCLGMQDLNSQKSNQTHAPCSGSMESSTEPSGKALSLFLRQQ